MDSFYSIFYLPLTCSCRDHCFYPFTQKSREAGKSIQNLGRGIPLLEECPWAASANQRILGPAESQQWDGHASLLQGGKQGWWAHDGTSQWCPVLKTVGRGSCIQRHLCVGLLFMGRCIPGRRSHLRLSRDRKDWSRGAPSSIDFMQ